VGLSVDWLWILWNLASVWCVSIS
jgi:hypothetical protein